MKLTLAATLLTIASGAFAQVADSVDVTFFYTPGGNPGVVYLPGEFNAWGNTQGGRIFDSRFAMSKDAAGVWSKTIRLRVGGPSPLPNPGKSIPGAYQYKFNENGSLFGWLPDPLNPRHNQLDFNNSYLFITDPTIHYLLPNAVSGEVQSLQPEITAYVFPALGATVDTASIRLEIDQTAYTGLGDAYDAQTRQLTFMPPEPLSRGTHSLRLFVSSSSGSVSADSTTFTVVGPLGFVHFLTRPDDRYLHATKTVVGQVGSPGLAVNLSLNGRAPTVAMADANGRFSWQTALEEGLNTFRAQVTDTLGVVQNDSLAITYFVDHSPKPRIFFSLAGGNQMKLIFSANDPDGDTVTVRWRSDDAINPAPLAIDSQAPEVTIALPSTPGEYNFDLVATDPDSNSGVARSYFTVKANGNLSFSGTSKNPQWVQDAVVYEIFVPAFTAEGTLAAAQERLPTIKSLGANVIWLMPIYDNGKRIDELDAGYNITNFFKVHPQLGTNADFQSFVDAAHALGMRVILDSTPNHVSENHPWVEDVRKFQDFSNFRPFLENQIKGDSRGLGQSAKRIGNYTLYVHYSNWTLANLDYDNIETRDFMLGMYKYWVLEHGVDGYRMDAYWGPNNRYGKSAWWRPFREEIKRVRPDVLILGETDGTGIGSENNYADFGGANDAAYDWVLFGGFREAMNGGSVAALHSRVSNSSPNLRYNHFTGINSHYLRFLENHDETRIAQVFRSDFRRTRAGAAILLTIPGMPLIYAGQEVGETSRRGKIDWNRAGASVTLNYYQRLGAIRGTFPAFRSNEIKQVGAGAASVYAYLRPWQDGNGIAAVNLSGNTVAATLALSETDLRLSAPLQTGIDYYLNDVLNDTSYVVTKETIGSFGLNLGPWQAAVFVLADSTINLVTSVASPAVAVAPEGFELYQNFPNPFNPSTNIRFALRRSALVHLELFNVLGEKVRDLLRENRPAGEFTAQWDGKNDRGIEAPSGLYLLRMSVVEGNAQARVVRTMKLMKLK